MCACLGERQSRVCSRPKLSTLRRGPLPPLPSGDIGLSVGQNKWVEEVGKWQCGQMSGVDREDVALGAEVILAKVPDTEDAEALTALSLIVLGNF